MVPMLHSSQLHSQPEEGSQESLSKRAVAVEFYKSALCKDAKAADAYLYEPLAEYENVEEGVAFRNLNQADAVLDWTRKSRQVIGEV